MSKRHYFIGQFDLNSKDVKCLDTEIIHQIKDVLKFKIGEEVVLCDGKGKAAIGILKQIDKKSLEFLMIDFFSTKKNDQYVVLCAAMLKRDSFEWLLQKAVEVGVDEIIPIISERTVKIGANEKRWQKIIKEAAEQSERLLLPKLHAPQSLKDALKIKGVKKIFFDPSGDSIDKLKTKDRNIAVFIGPEGGWNESEINQAKTAEAVILKLGDTILRGETAGVIAVYLAKNTF